MPLVSQFELDSMRGDHNESLPDEASVYHQGTESDGQGGTVPVGSPELVGTWDARLSPLSSAGSSIDEAVFGGRLGTGSGWILTLPFGASFEFGDTVTFLFKETFETKDLEIVGVMDPRTHQIGIRLACLEIR